MASVKSLATRKGRTRSSKRADAADRGRSIMPAFRDRLQVLSATIVLLAATSTAAITQKYNTGATDTEIKIGSILPYSGPASAYGVIGKTEAAYFKKINAEGGINGRKIKFISYDDAYSPPKTVEQARKLVESDEVLLIFGPLGTASNSTIQKYMNEKKVPQLFVQTGATKWNDPKQFPWTMGWQPNYQSEGRIYAKYILKERPTGKIGILYQNDDYGKDYVEGIRDGLGAKAVPMIVGEESYETTTPTIDSHVVALKSEGANIFISITTPKFAAQSIKKVAELGWRPLFILNSVGTSTGTDMRPAGFENSQNIISATYQKDPTDPQWNDDAGIKNFDAFLTKYLPKGNREDPQYNDWLRCCSYDGSCSQRVRGRSYRANIMKQPASIKSLQMEGLLPRRHDQHPAQLIPLRSSNFSSGKSRPSVGNCSAMSSVARSAGRA
jgi:ABC-type branched-subunit amino acid transport system substrate-binding protein